MHWGNRRSPQRMRQYRLARAVFQRHDLEDGDTTALETFDGLGQHEAMVTSCKLMVFSDLDGTLIDHDTYDHTPAAPAIEALEAIFAGLVLASSKTAPEMSALRTEIGAEKWPAIIENGAGVLPPFSAECPTSDEYESVRLVLASLPDSLRNSFCGFGDMSVNEVARMTGLSVEAAARAKHRSFSEPGIWSGPPEQKQIFLAALRAQGVRAQQGGRFLTLSLGRNKVDQMRDIIADYRPQYTIALGDAPNDIEMLENADIGIVVANPAHQPLPLLKTESEGRIIRTKHSGPVGWNLAVFDAMTRLGLG